MDAGLQGDGTKGGTKNGAAAEEPGAAEREPLAADIRASTTEQAADPFERLRVAVRDLISAGPPPLPPDLMADLLRLAVAAAGNDATRAGGKPARVAGATSMLGSEEVRDGEP